MGSGSLFDRVVAASGLTPVVAPYTIRRLLIRENVVPPERLTRSELARVLPRLLAALEVYLPGEEFERMKAALEELAKP